jgi:flagellar hook-associated protein 1 FlgK
MTTLAGILHIGRSTLGTHQAAIGVVSGNTANADVAGYSRRDVSMRQQVGGGVGIAAVLRRSSSMVEQRVLMANARFGAHQAKADSLAIVETRLDEGSNSLGSRIDAFFASMRTLATQPADPQLRADVTTHGRALAQAFNATAATIERERAAADAALRTEVARVSELTQAIARANESVAATAPGSSERADQQDARARLVQELGGLVEISTLAGDNDGLTVLLQGGTTLVQGSSAATLRATSDPALGGFARVDLVDVSGAAYDVSGILRGGTVGGRLEARDESLTDVLGRIDAMAFDFMSAFNAAHASGFGTDGVGGRAFFDGPATVAGSAAGMQLAAGMQDNPAWVAAGGSVATASGGNENLLALIGLADANITQGGTVTLGGGGASLIAEVGRASRAESDAALDAQTQLEQERALLQSQTGVSLDEELVDLSRFERAYQAGARIIEAVEKLYEAVLSL